LDKACLIFTQQVCSRWMQFELKDVSKQYLCPVIYVKYASAVCFRYMFLACVNLIKQKIVLTSFSPLYFVSSVMMLSVPTLWFLKHSMEGLFSSNGSLYDIYWLYPPVYLLSLIVYFLSPCLPCLFSHLIILQNTLALIPIIYFIIFLYLSFHLSWKTCFNYCILSHAPSWVIL
jgi:hypothetical protein